MVGAVISIGIVLIIFGGATVGTVSYFRLQRHRADAVAMASYRKLAEEAVAAQAELHDRLTALDARITEVVQLLRSVE
jgi:hypothetical protein